MRKIGSFEEWVAKYKPEPNLKEDPEGSILYFETYGEDLKYVQSKASENKVWTIIQGDSEALYIISGIHFVNRLNYLIATIPYDPATAENEEYSYISEEELAELE